MRYLVLSDIHANVDALDVVLEAAGPVGYDKVLVLGDLVGYAAAPDAVVGRIRALEPERVIRGNHDRVAAGLSDTAHFNPLASRAVQWTVEHTTPEHRAYLAQLEPGPVEVTPMLSMCHGTPYDEDAYILDSLEALRAVQAAPTPWCLFGHTHVPAVIVLRAGELTYDGVLGGDVVSFENDGRYLINVGSVGQPRDGIPDAAWGVVDTDQQHVEFYRTPYDIAAAQQRIREAGLPEALALRLAAGR